jgi:membrane protein implicated in regulation of membrane protease activity
VFKSFASIAALGFGGVLLFLAIAALTYALTFAGAYVVAWLAVWALTSLFDVAVPLTTMQLAGILFAAKLVVEFLSPRRASATTQAPAEPVRPRYPVSQGFGRR